MSSKIETVYKQFGKSLRRMRQANGWSLAYVSSRLTPPQTRASISGMELGTRRTPLHVMMQIADLFDAYLYEMVDL